MDETPARKRSRLACNPCRERKRKCDGSNPCGTCTSYGYSCVFEHQPRQRRKRGYHAAPDVAIGGGTSAGTTLPDASQQSPASTAPTHTPAETDHNGLAQRLEGNSGAAFVRRLGLKIDPARAPKLNLFGWNVGTRALSIPVNPMAPVLSVFEITTLEHVKSLTQCYFDKIDVCYGFLNVQVFTERLEKRYQEWQLRTNYQGGNELDVYDSVIAGVAALGCLFSRGSATLAQTQLVRTALHILNAQSLVNPPSIDLITGWTLRTIYLRLTDSPYAVWMASCTLMHMVEASGLYEAEARESNSDVDRGTVGRLVGVAHHLHIWTSFDLGLTRVAFLKTDLSLPPPPPPQERNPTETPSAMIDATAELLGLLPMSVSLDPTRPRDVADLTATLAQLLARKHSLAPSVLAQCNLVLCLLRRFHTQHLDVAPDLADGVLSLLRRGLACARDMALNCSPWHQVSNVPFQTICILLVMDTRASLTLLPTAMQTLTLVASIYNTERMREAHSAARLLVCLHQQRRRDDLAVLGAALQTDIQQQQPALPETQSQPVVPVPQNGILPSTVQPAGESFPSAEEFSWLGALVADLPGLQQVDLEQFLATDLIDDPSLGI